MRAPTVLFLLRERGASVVGVSSIAGLATAAAAPASSLPTRCHLSQLRSTGWVKDCRLQQSSEKIPLPVHCQGSWRGAPRSKHCTGTLSFECLLGSQLSLSKAQPVKPSAPARRQAGAACRVGKGAQQGGGRWGARAEGRGSWGEAGGIGVAGRLRGGRTQSRGLGGELGEHPAGSGDVPAPGQELLCICAQRLSHLFLTPSPGHHFH